MKAKLNGIERHISSFQKDSIIKHSTDAVILWHWEANALFLFYHLFMNLNNWIIFLVYELLKFWIKVKKKSWKKYISCCFPKIFQRNVVPKQAFWGQINLENVDSHQECTCHHIFVLQLQELGRRSNKVPIYRKRSSMTSVLLSVVYIF